MIALYKQNPEDLNAFCLEMIDIDFQTLPHRNKHFKGYKI